MQVATLYSVSLGVLPPALCAWRGNYRDVQIRLFEHRHADELRDAMIAGKADLAVGPPPADWDGPVRTLGVEEFVVVLPADEPAARDHPARVELAALADRGWVQYAPGNGLADLLDQPCAAAGFRPRNRGAHRTDRGRARAGRRRARPGLVPANIIPPRFDGCVRRPIRGTLSASTRSQPDLLTAAFIETLATKAWITPKYLRRGLLQTGDETDTALSSGNLLS